MKLEIPKEPSDILRHIRSVHSQMSEGSDIDWASFSVWAANKLPQYLWNEWKDTLKPQGLTWQKFSRLLRMRTDKMIGWLKGLNSWEMLTEDIQDLIESPLGQDIAKKN